MTALALYYRVLYTLRRPLLPILRDRGLYCAAHTVLAILFALEAGVLAHRVVGPGIRLGAYLGYYLLAAVATVAVCICVVMNRWSRK